MTSIFLRKAKRRSFQKGWHLLFNNIPPEKEMPPKIWLIQIFTGDLVTIGRCEAEPYTETLSKLSAENGTVSVLGNHDFLIYERKSRNQAERKAAVDSLADYENNILGWNLLRNSSKRIDAPDGSHITIVGVDNRNCSNQGFHTMVPRRSMSTRGLAAPLLSA